MYGNTKKNQENVYFYFVMAFVGLFKLYLSNRKNERNDYQKRLFALCNILYTKEYQIQENICIFKPLFNYL